MQNHTAASLEELKAILSTFGGDALFRGQVRQFGSDCEPKMDTSFSRSGCIPPLMLRWSHYAGFTLAALLGRNYKEINPEFQQAILQHYGWRSFYLDASSEPAQLGSPHMCSAAAARSNFARTVLKTLFS